MHLRNLTNDTASNKLYTLPLHDALPILSPRGPTGPAGPWSPTPGGLAGPRSPEAGSDRFIDRKSTRLNSSHVEMSYAVFCLKKKNNDTCVVTRQSTIR